MSSPLHSATCVGRSNCVVDIELAPTPAIGAHFPLSDFFALALLHESATQTVFTRPGKPLRRIGKPPLASVATVEQMMDLACAPKDDARRVALVKRCIVRAEYQSTRNWSPALHRRDGSGSYVPAPRARADVSAASQALQASFDEAHRVSHHAPEPLRAMLPAATLRIEVTDPAWCGHLAAPLCWDVYAFDEEMDLFI